MIVPDFAMLRVIDPVQSIFGTSFKLVWLPKGICTVLGLGLLILGSQVVKNMEVSRSGF